MFVPTRSVCREWLPAVLMTLSVLAAGYFASTRKTLAEERIQNLDALGLTLSESAAEACHRTILPQEQAEVSTARRDLQQRLADVLQPSLVQAELVQSAVAAGVTLKEISPLPAVLQSGRPGALPTYPRYRLRVQGTYRQVANYLDLCGRQRLPARVTGLILASRSMSEDLPPDQLSAEITVESFLPRPPEKGGEKP